MWTLINRSTWTHSRLSWHQADSISTPPHISNGIDTCTSNTDCKIRSNKNAFQKDAYRALQWPSPRGVCLGGGGTVSAQGNGDVCRGDVCPGGGVFQGLSGWGCLPRGVSAHGCLPGVVCLPRGVSAQSRACQTPPVNRMIDRCKTLPPKDILHSLIL